MRTIMSARYDAPNCRNLPTTTPRTAGVGWSTSRATSSLCGVVTDKPAMSMVRIASKASAAWPSATGKATYTQSSPHSA